MCTLYWTSDIMFVHAGRGNVAEVNFNEAVYPNGTVGDTEGYESQKVPQCSSGYEPFLASQNTYLTCQECEVCITL